MSIKIFYDDVGYSLRGLRKAQKLIKKVIGNENRIPGDLNFIVTSDKTIKQINTEFLKHNYFTDVITFDNNDGNVINGEVYISIDTVSRNAFEYNVSLNDELLRVMVHGVLHLCGYNDSSKGEKKKMREMENRWLDEFDSKSNDI